MTTNEKPRYVTNGDTHAFTNLETCLVISIQTGPIINGKQGYRVTAYFAHNATAILAMFSRENDAIECLKMLTYYIISSKDPITKDDADMFIVHNVIDDTNIILPEQGNVTPLFSGNSVA